MGVKSKDLKTANKTNPLFAVTQQERDLIQQARAGDLDSLQWDLLAIQVLGLMLGALLGGLFSSPLSNVLKAILFGAAFIIAASFIFYQMKALNWAAVGHFVVAYTVPLGLIFMLPWWPAKLLIILGSIALATYVAIALGHRPGAKSAPSWRSINKVDREAPTGTSQRHYEDDDLASLPDQNGDGSDDDFGQQYRAERNYRP